MKSDCAAFRAALEAELAGRPSQEKLAWLAWHEHLLACAECRELLEKEEALEALLATLPDPKLPDALLRRVLARLRKERAEETRLEGLLDVLEEEIRPPAGLAAGILARVAAERGDRLDALLDLDRSIEAPEGLAARVLARLGRERRRPRALPWLYAAAAGLALLLFGRFLWTRTRLETGPPKELLAQEAPPDPELLASLDVVEQWDLLMQDDVDVLLSTLGPADEALLDYR
jgi:hypothetical protein